MKKYFLTALLMGLVPALHASDLNQELRSNPGNVAMVPQVKEAAPPAINPQKILDDFKTDPANYEAKGGVFGIFSAVVPKIEAVEGLFHALAKGHEEYKDQTEKRLADLSQQLQVTNNALKDSDAIRQALGEKQKDFDSLAAKMRALEEELTAAQSRAHLLKTKEQGLLLEASKKDAAHALESARKTFLESENLHLKKIIAELAANEQEIERILAENRDHEESLQIKTEGTQELDETQQRIKAVLERNKGKIVKLQGEKASFEASKLETEDRIQKLQKAIEANDYYTQILSMINNKDASDDNLALFMWSVTNVLGTDLDELSKGREIRLIQRLIEVSRPYKNHDHRYRHNDLTEMYMRNYRTLGNLFVKKGLTWGGDPLDFNECLHKGSSFEANSKEMARLAQEKLSKRN
jgi:hypothetical protein